MLKFKIKNKRLASIKNFKQFKFYTLIALMVIFLSFFIFSDRSNIKNIRAATYGWVQTTWSGGASSTAVATHTNDQSGWTFFKSKDTDLNTVNNELKISMIAGTVRTENTNADFTAGSSTNAYVANNSVIMQKPINATCSVNTDCASNYCIGSPATCQIPPVECDGSTGTLVCGNLCSYKGDVYSTVQIGPQCWLADSLRTTVYPDGSPITKGDPNDPGHGGGTFGTSATAYYSCPSNASQTGEDCAAAGGSLNLGMYYQWNAAMNGSSYVATGPGPRGICPKNWHIPTDDGTINSDIGLLVNSVSSISGCSGSEATCLRSGGASGFNFPWSGYRDAAGNYWRPSQYIRVWTASQDQPGGWWRWDDLSSNVISWQNSNDMAMPVRCVRN